MARRLLHMSKAMMRHRIIYLPPELRHNTYSQREQLLVYLQETWPKLVSKWRDAKALDLHGEVTTQGQSKGSSVLPRTHAESK